MNKKILLKYETGFPILINFSPNLTISMDIAFQKQKYRQTNPENVSKS